MKEYETIKELYEAVKSGEIDESELEIVLDNDCTLFYTRLFKDKNGEVINNRVIVKKASGYEDVELLYRLLFPKAEVCWS